MSQNKNASNESNSDLFYTSYGVVPKKVSPEQIRKHKEYSTASEEKVNLVIETLYKLSIITYKILSEKNLYLFISITSIHISY